MKNLRHETEAFYTEVLKSLRITVDDDGRCHYLSPDDTKAFAIVDDKPLYVPVKGTLDGDKINEIQHFHPLCESLSRKTPSPVIEYMKRIARMNIGIYVKVILEKLMAVASNPELQDELPAATTGYLKKVPHANEKTLKKLETVITKAVRKNLLVNVYCRGGGKYEGTPVTRLTTIQFPIINLIANNEEKCKSLGITFASKRERETILSLMEYVLPGGQDHETYSAGSNSQIAPFFESFMEAYEKIVTQLNALLKRHRSSMDLQLDPFPTKAFTLMEKVPDYYEHCGLPRLSGNEGGLKEISEAKTSDRDDTPASSGIGLPTPRRQTNATPSSTSNTPPPWDPTAAPATPEVAPAPSSGNGMSMKEFMASKQPQQPMYNPQMYGQQPQMGYGMGQPQQPSSFAGLRQTFAQNNPQLGGSNYQSHMNNGGQPMDVFQQHLARPMNHGSQYSGHSQGGMGNAPYGYQEPII